MIPGIVAEGSATLPWGAVVPQFGDKGFLLVYHQAVLRCLFGVFFLLLSLLCNSETALIIINVACYLLYS